MRKSIVILLTLNLFWVTAIAQQPKKAHAGEIYESIKKLNVLASALYVAAHPDDENQRLISYLSNEVKANTTYLSLTRGDGGQNIVGPEIKEQLGIIRTHELLGARSKDGGNQTFSRAIDFGYSKHPDETLRIWNKEEVLADVVWAIRKYQPDVIINRFDHRRPGKTHGHHTSSAMLSVEAFDLSGDKTVYPKQLNLVDVWQPSRIFYNTSWWAFGGRDKFAKADKSHLMSVDIGVYFPSLGKSNTEIAAEARTSHKSQGFGATGSRGSQLEYLEILKGELPSDRENIFEGIDISWNRVKGGAAIEGMINQVIKDYDIGDPAKSVKSLVKVKKAIASLESNRWKEIKGAEIDQIIIDATGLYVEAVTDKDIVAQGEEIELALEVVNRSSIPMTWKKFSVPVFSKDSLITTDLNPNEKLANYFTFKISNNQDTRPYWLKQKGTTGMYHVTDQNQIGVPISPSPYQAIFEMEIDGEPFTITKEFVYKENDRVKGEVYKPFYIVPAVSAKIENPVYIYKDNQAQQVAVTIKSFQADLQGSVSLDIPKGWKISPQSTDFALEQSGEEEIYRFNLTPPAGDSDGMINPVVKIGGKKYSESVFVIDYEYIPQQISIENSESRVVKSAIKKLGQNIAYIMGAGDKVPEAMTQIGYEVTLLDVEKINSETLSGYDAVVLGIRAYNTEKDLKLKQKYLFDYVEKGGTMIVQYMTTWGLDVKEMGPYPIKLGRKRVTDEFAPVKFELPDHQVLNSPNKITDADFEGWVQERGLYFASEWDEKFETPLSWHDTGEDPQLGSLLIAEHGEGHFIYTGISWFRQLPAGVPGAYKLFANLVSIGK